MGYIQPHEIASPVCPLLVQCHWEQRVGAEHKMDSKHHQKHQQNTTTNSKVSTTAKLPKYPTARYSIESALGCGAFSDVYAGRDTVTGARVAIKVNIGSYLGRELWS